MTALTVWLGLEERLKTVQGLTNIMLGEPTSIHETPALATVLARFERPMEGHPPSDNLTAMIYFFTHRLYIQWVDNPQAQAELLSFVNAIPYAISEDAKLALRLGQGMATIETGDAGFVDVGTTRYLILDFHSRVLEKLPRSQAL